MKKKSVIVAGILFIIIAALLGISLLPADSTQSQNLSASVSIDTSSFENNFYDYLAQSLEEIFVSGNNQDSEYLGLKVRSLTDEGIGMIDEYIAEQNKGGRALNEADYNRLDQLRFYVYSSIALDEEMSRKSLEPLPNNANKLALLYTYIETFTKEDSREISRVAFENYLQEQASWAQALEEDYLDKVVSIQFKADPIGKPLPNHLAKYQDTEGRSLDLNNFRGKYVLLDFWATWCLPCIVELPYLQEAYQNFNRKGFEIISVSLDNNRDAFNGFISDRNISWIQYYDGKSFRGELVRDYEVTGIPTLYLIDREGKTISVNMRGEELIRILNSHLGT